MENNHLLFQPFRLNDHITLNNRVVMAPLTRRRAENSALAADDTIALYYKQRASAGLIISEGSQISPQAYGYTNTPGCFTNYQIEAWKKVTHEVHKEKGKIFLQLWHVGPFSHKDLQPGNLPPLSASPIVPRGQVLTPQGKKNYESSRAMSEEEIQKTIMDFAKAAQNALISGFDGVEIHAAHAYLIDQFIMDGTNQRNDRFGGSVENRSRFLFMILEEILKTIPANRVGIRLSPKAVKEDMEDSQPFKTYGYIGDKLNDYHLAYLHLSEMMSVEERLKQNNNSIVPYYRKIYKGNLISCGGHTYQSAVDMLNKNMADLIAFGKPFISNPDLVDRMRKNIPLQQYDKDTFYHGGKKGYTDYPFYEDTNKNR
ncbi:MAG: alkene reductase, partial [Bacteroidota bacterium]